MLYVKITYCDFGCDEDSTEIKQLNISNKADFNEWYYGYLLNEYHNICHVHATAYLDADCTIPAFPRPAVPQAKPVPFVELPF